MERPIGGTWIHWRGATHAVGGGVASTSGSDSVSIDIGAI
jgi:hypothetical protein